MNPQVFSPEVVCGDEHVRGALMRLAVTVAKGDDTAADLTVLATALYNRSRNESWGPDGAATSVQDVIDTLAAL